jgi:glycerate kinase
MKKFVLIPDSFKGTLSSRQVCDILEKEIVLQYPDSTITKIPVADGGEGSVDAFLEALGGEKVFVSVTGPFFEKMTAFYGLIENGKTAVIEMAACAGLPLVEECKNPSKTTTYGVGELIKSAMDRGVTKVILGLGGSCTNDGGAGCASALGVRFYDQNNELFVPVGGTLSKIAKIDLSSRDQRLNQIEIISMCDIDNPLYGKEGAAFVFSPQKGANPDMVEFLDHQLADLARAAEKWLGFSEWNFKGAGAAGGMGFGMKVFLGSRIQMGIETVLDVTQFNRLIQGVDYIVTGEGRLDSQSLRGKVVIGVARRAKREKAKVIAVVGCMSGEKQAFLNEGIDAIVVTNYQNLPFDEVKKRAEKDMSTTFSEFLQTLRS